MSDNIIQLNQEIIHNELFLACKPIIGKRGWKDKQYPSKKETREVDLTTLVSF